MKTIPTPDRSIRFHPWFCFVWFLLALSALAYARLPFYWNAWIFLFGLVLPSVFLYTSLNRPEPSAHEKPFFLTEDSLGKGLNSPWVLVFLLFLAALLRFWGIGTLSRWPEVDPALTALSVIPWMDHLQWKPFVTLSQVPSTLYYLFYLVTKLTGSFLLGIQIPSTFLSFLTLLAAYACARIFFTRSISFILGTLFAFNAWDLMLSRSDEAGVLLPLWECLVFWVFGRLAISQSQSARRSWACLLGLALGLGPYTFMAWPVLMALVLVTTLGFFWKKREGVAGGFFFFSLFLIMIPFLLAVRRENYGGHLHDVAAWTNPSFSWLGQAGVVFSYFQSIFWGGTTGMELPPSGGFLNPLLGSFCILGFLEIIYLRRYFLSRFLLASLPLFLLPGLLSRDVEAHRILLVAPILLVIVSVGMTSLIRTFPPRFQVWGLVAVLALSSLWDIHRVLHPPTHVGTNEYRDSYGVLEPLSRQKGPGWIFSDMLPNTQDYSLAYCSYPFNAAWNNHLSQDVKWAAVFTQTHYLPFLARTFPSGQWRIAPAGQTGQPSRHVFGLLPVTPETRPLLEKWKLYYTLQQDMNMELADLPTGQTHRAVLEKFLSAYPKIPDDTFLQSCYFERLAYHLSWENTFHPEDNWANWKNFSGTFRASFEKSYQDAELCEKYGRLLAVEGDDRGAKSMLDKALKLSPGNPWLKDEIKQLGLGS